MPTAVEIAREAAKSAAEAIVADQRQLSRTLRLSERDAVAEVGAEIAYALEQAGYSEREIRAMGTYAIAKNALAQAGFGNLRR